MKLWSVLLVFLVTVVRSAGYAQEGASSHDEPEHTVAQALEEAGRGVSTSWTEKALNRLGDSCAVSITKLLAGRSPTNEDKRRILVVINFCFAEPKLISQATDRQPRTTLFLLAYLDALPGDQVLRKQVAQTRAVLQQLAILPQPKMAPSRTN